MSYRNQDERAALRRLQAGIALTLGLVAASAGAAQWEARPRVEAGYLFDDNYRLDVPGSEIEVSGALADASLELRNASQVNEFTVTPRIRATYFPDERDEDSTDYFLELANLHRSQRSRFEVAAAFADETVATTEQPRDDLQGNVDPLGTAGGADSGRASIRNRRQLIELAPTFAHDFSQRQMFELGARYRNVDFDDLAVEQIAYEDLSASVGYGFRRSARDTFIVRALSSRYEPDLTDYEATGYGLEGEWSMQLSPNSRAYVRAGAQRTEVERRTLETSDTDYVAGAGGEWSGQAYTALVDVTRGVGPTASGFVVVRDQIRLRFTRSLSERNRLFFALRGMRDDATEEASGYAQRRYANGRVGYEWLMSRTVSLGAAYDYTWQEFADEPDDRRSQGVSLTLIYQPLVRE